MYWLKERTLISMFFNLLDWKVKIIQFFLFRNTAFNKQQFSFELNLKAPYYETTTRTLKLYFNVQFYGTCTYPSNTNCITRFLPVHSLILYCIIVWCWSESRLIKVIFILSLILISAHISHFYHCLLYFAVFQFKLFVILCKMQQ